MSNGTFCKAQYLVCAYFVVLTLGVLAGKYRLHAPDFQQRMAEVTKGMTPKSAGSDLVWWGDGTPQHLDRDCDHIRPHEDLTDTGIERLHSCETSFPVLNGDEIDTIEADGVISVDMEAVTSGVIERLEQKGLLRACGVGVTGDHSQCNHEGKKTYEPVVSPTSAISAGIKCVVEAVNQAAEAAREIYDEVGVTLTHDGIEYFDGTDNLKIPTPHQHTRTIFNHRGLERYTCEARHTHRYFDSHGMICEFSEDGISTMLGGGKCLRSDCPPRVESVP